MLARYKLIFSWKKVIASFSVTGKLKIVNILENLEMKKRNQFNREISQVEEKQTVCQEEINFHCWPFHICDCL